MLRTAGVSLGPKKVKCVDEGEVAQVELGALLPPAHRERFMGQLDRPEQPGGRDTAVVVVDLRARPGREQVNSHLRECPFVSFAILRNVFALHDPDVCLKVIRHAVTPSGGADVVRQGGDTREVGDGARLDVQALQGDEGEGKGDVLRAG